MSKLTEARQLVGGLSKPGKMPGPAYSIPARECKTGRKLRGVVGSTCADCYALKGRYMFPNVQAAQYRRLSAMDKPGWISAMVTAINGAPFFRWFDSGDLQSLEHLTKIVEVCNATSDTKHWLPTREKQIVRDYLRLRNFPGNLTVRLSAAMVDGKPPVINSNIVSGRVFPFPICTSTVHHDAEPIGYACPAPTQGNRCGDCRACWDKTVSNVSYHKH